MATSFEPAVQRAPAAIRRTGLTLLALLLAGSAYLIWARGEAIVVDLANLAGKVWCF